MPPPVPRPRVTTVRERKEILEAARARFNTVPIEHVMQDYGLIGKMKRMKINGVKTDVLQLRKVHRGHDGIVMTSCQYVNVHAGYTGYGGGSAFNFAREYVPAYADLSDQEAAEKFAMKYLPHLMREYEETMRPMPEEPQTRESFAILTQRIREEQSKTSAHRKEQNQGRDGWER